jgi:hypothetical protein
MRLISEIFPDRCRYCELFGNDFRLWSLCELKQAFKALISDESRKVFFLIEGEDGFHGDEAELASYILEIVSTRRNVKMYVASQSWLVFEDEF